MDDVRSLVTQAQEGDLGAFGEIVRRFQDMAYGYAYSFLGDFHLAEDAAQEAFIEAYRGLLKLRDPAAFPGWFRRIVFKRCDRLTRGKRAHTVPLESAGGLTHNEPGPSENAERREMRDKVLEAIRSLPERERAVTTLYYINGYSQQDVADFLEVPVTTVNNRLHASRERLKERMMNMVGDTLKDHTLPEDFTQKTVDEALKRAEELDKECRWEESEQMLREVLENIPDHPDLLGQLNHALQRGRIWGGQKYGLLLDLVKHGKAALGSAGDRADVCWRIANTLLYIPDMPEAIEFIGRWMAEMGRSTEALRRLAWAQACMGRFEDAYATWEEIVAMAAGADAEQGLGGMGRACLSLVDCLSSCGQTEPASRILHEGWALAREMAVFRHRARWCGAFNQCGLREEAGEVAREWHAVLGALPEQDEDAAGAALMARAWFDDKETVTADWLAWVQRLAAEGEPAVLQFVVPRMFATLQWSGDLAWRRDLGLETARVMGESSNETIARFAETFVEPTALDADVWLEAGDADTAEEVAREAMARGHAAEVKFLHDVAVMRGEPSPPELMQEIDEKGPAEAAHGAWYLVAREAAAAGEEGKAFEALQRACEECWWVRPIERLNMWENDARWGPLREHPEFKRIIEEKRRRVGPCCGQVMYSPGW